MVDLMISNVPMSKLRLQNLGGRVWMQLRRDASLVPPWDKLLAAPFWREAEFRLIRKRLREGSDTKVLETVDPGVPGGGIQVGRTVHGVCLQDGECKKEVVWGNMLGVLRHRPVDALYVELDGDDDQLPPIIVEEMMSGDRPPSLMVFGTVSALNVVVHQLEENCPNRIRNGALISFFMDADPPRGGRRSGELNVERRGFVFSPLGIVGHHSYAVIQVHDIGPLVPMYLLNLIAENPEYALLEEVPIQNLVIIPGKTCKPMEAMNLLAQVVASVGDEWTGSVVVPNIMEGESLRPALLENYARHLLRFQRVFADMDLLLSGMPVRHSTRNVKDDTTEKAEREQLRQLKRAEKARKKKERHMAKEEKRQQREEEKRQRRLEEEQTQAETQAEVAAPEPMPMVYDSEEEEPIQTSERRVTRASDDREKERKAREQALQEEEEQRQQALQEAGKKRKAADEGAAGGAKKSKSPGFTEGGTPKPSPRRKVAGLPSPPAVQSKSSKK
jgi:hypothetical protein